ncbi:Actin-related protein 02-03-2020 complex subunit [Caligus rogercresseyi]|uniref:Actin-related protein 02-03-2020 complex subunit n=1 Tax=Caligus rogercresseyi TaxID=217165 RepID=A0A7T8HFQ6_CALRO|nr:Actin-related protein 02-03-2020 complex subunit [Caligus rogercresseyi]
MGISWAPKFHSIVTCSADINNTYVWPCKEDSAKWLFYGETKQPLLHAIKIQRTEHIQRLLSFQHGLVGCKSHQETHELHI